MENSHTLSYKILLGGALLGAFLVLAFAGPTQIYKWARTLRINEAKAYDQENTHPALTDEIIDFFSLSFPDKKITEEEKRQLIKGAIDEDNGVRMLYHFYDPVYNRGLAMVAGASSKDWGLAANFQANVLGRQYAGFTSVFSSGSEADFSYGRALEDYAKGDRKRSLYAFGHILHLLEDAGVPDHTRDDPHPPILDWGSPYEHEMAKWSTKNFNIAKNLFLRREKPVSLNNIENYFDRVANYSNNNFFSKDTVNNDIYIKPNLEKTKRIKVNGLERLFIVNKDKDGKEFPIALIENSSDNQVIKDIVLKNSFINSYILDGYWERLSKEIVISGAGALNLFLEEAEKAKKEYLAKQDQKKPSFWAQILGVFGVGKELLTTPDVVPTSGVREINDDGDSGDTVVSLRVSPLSLSVSPSVSPTVSPTPIVSPMVTQTPINDIECPQDIRCQQLPKTTPTPKLITSDGQGASDVKKTGKVIINEIAWAGTEASATDEWIELYNSDNYDIDLSGWTIKADDGTPDITIEEGKIIKAQSYFLLERTNDATVNTIPADQFYAGALGNEGEVLKLSNSTGIIIDSIHAGGGWPAGSSAGKISMERKPDGNWKDFTGNFSAKDANGNFIYGSPRAVNSLGTIMMTGGGGNSSPTPSPTPSPSLTQSPTPSPTPTSSPDPSAPLLKVAINEIAWMGTATSSNDEWIELYNTTNQTVDLTGWTLKSLTGATPDPQITLSGTIQPFGFYLLERTDNTTISDISADKIYTGALSDTGETLELRNASGALQDKVSGNSGWYAGNKDTDSSMERTNPRQSGDNPENWNTNNGTTRNGSDAAGNPINGTPKAKNSGYVALKPSTVADLTATINSPFLVSWSAPSDLDTLPANLSYDLRYSLDDFSDDDNVWDDATKVASSDLPSVGEEGAPQSASFDISYEYGQTLYFALKTKVINIPTCDVGNVDNCEESDISNIAEINFPAALNNDSWAMSGKNQYHTSFANVAGLGVGAAISWEFDAGIGNAISQPVVSADGDIFFGAANGSSSKLIKLNKDGVKQWEYATNVSIGTPAVLSDEITYFGRIGAGGVLAFTALNSDSSKKWDYDDAGTVKEITVSPEGKPHFTFSSGSSDKLVVLNLDGSLKTTISNSGLGGFAPVVLDDGTIIAVSKVSGNQIFTAYSSDGTQLWQVFYTGANGSTPVNPSYDQSTSTTYSAAGSKLFDIPSDGSMINSREIAPWDYASATMVAISSDTLYVGFNHGANPASGSLLYALNKSDFSTKWSFQADSYVNQQIAVDSDGSTYFSTQDGKLYSVDASGNQRWVIDSGSNSAISPVLTKNGLIWGYGNRIARISN